MAGRRTRMAENEPERRRSGDGPGPEAARLRHRWLVALPLRVRVVVTGFVVLPALVLSGCWVEEREPDVPDTAPDVELPVVRPDPPVDRDPDPARVGEEAVEELEVGDEFWAGAGTAGAEVVARFVSPGALDAALDRDAPVTRHQDREWALGDILVSVDFRAGVDGAVWRVAGPPEVVAAYLERLREDADARGPIRELGILPLEVRYRSARPGTGVIP